MDLSDTFRDVYPVIDKQLKKLPATEARKIRQAGLLVDIRAKDVRLRTDRILHSISETAELTSMSVMTINRFIKNGTLPFIKLGGRRLIPRRELMDLIEKQTERATRERKDHQ